MDEPASGKRAVWKKSSPREFKGFMVEKPEKGEEIEILVSEKDKERIKQR